MALLVLGLAVGLVGCESSSTSAVAETAGGKVEACRAARNMLDANIAANLTSEFGEDEQLRAEADQAAVHFFTIANQVDDDEFAEWAARWRFATAGVKQELQGLEFDSNYAGAQDGVSSFDLDSVASDEIYERCRDEAGVNIRRDRELIAEYDVSERERQRVFGEN